MGVGIRGLLFILVLLAMPLAAWWFVFKPQNGEIEQAKKEIEQKRLMLQKLEAATRQTADLARANEEIARGISMIESRLPTNKEVDVILEQVSDLARSSKLDIPRVKALDPVQSAKYMEQPLTMTITGNFDDFYSFLLKLERLDRITRLPDVKFERSDKVDGAMQATFTLSIYFQPDSSFAGSRS